jgi:hypothetical protein
MSSNAAYDKAGIDSPRTRPQPDVTDERAERLRAIGQTRADLIVTILRWLR